MSRTRLLTDKELIRLQQAMDSGQEIAIEVSIAGMQIKASTTPATPVWGCDMLVRLECTRGPVYSTQYFDRFTDFRERVCAL